MTVNYDIKTGCYYGVISQHSVSQFWCDESEPIYNEIEEGMVEDCDYEPIGYEIVDQEYEAMDCLDTDIMITKSKYYTHANECSPCCPHAGNLDSPNESGAKTYCFNHDCFEGGVAPYKVYSVETDKEVKPN